MKKNLPFMVCLLLMLLTVLPSEGKKYDFTFDVHAIGEYDFNGKKFRVEPLYEDIKRDDKAFLELSKPVISYFKLCGADWADNAKDVDFVLQVGWGSNLTEDRVECTPRYVTDSYTYSYIDCWGNIWDVTDFDDRLVGYDTETYKEWTKYVKIKTVDYHGNKPGRTLWEMVASTKDTHNSSLGEAFYYMLYGSCEYIGHSSGGTKCWEMSTRCESDLMYDWIRSGSLCYSKSTIYPELLTTAYCDGKGLDVFCVERLDDRLVVTFSFDGKGSYLIPETLAIAYTDAQGNEKAEWPTAVNGITLGKSSKAYYFQVTFPAIPNNVKKITIYDSEAKEDTNDFYGFYDIAIR